MSLFTDIQQIEATQRATLAKLGHVEDDITAGFKAVEAGQDDAAKGQQAIIVQLESIANATVSIGTGIQAIIDKLQELIDIVRGPPVVGIAIEPGTPTPHEHLKTYPSTTGGNP